MENNKQETLEEVAKKMLSDNKHKKATFETMIEFAKWQKEQYTIEEQHVEHSINDLDKSYMKGFNEGAEWQQERMYSEEEVLNFTQTMIMQYKFGNTNIEQMDLLKETLQLFKNK